MTFGRKQIKIVVFGVSIIHLTKSSESVQQTNATWLPCYPSESKVRPLKVFVFVSDSSRLSDNIKDIILNKILEQDKHVFSVLHRFALNFVVLENVEPDVRLVTKNVLFDIKVSLWEMFL